MNISVLFLGTFLNFRSFVLFNESLQDFSRHAILIWDSRICPYCTSAVDHIAVSHCPMLHSTAHCYPFPRCKDRIQELDCDLTSKAKWLCLALLKAARCASVNIGSMTRKI